MMMALPYLRAKVSSIFEKMGQSPVIKVLDFILCVLICLAFLAQGLFYIIMIYAKEVKWGRNVWEQYKEAPITLFYIGRNLETIQNLGNNKLVWLHVN